MRGGVGVGVRVDSGNGPGLRFCASRLGAPTLPAFFSIQQRAPSWPRMFTGVIHCGFVRTASGIDTFTRADKSVATRVHEPCSEPKAERID